MDRQELNEQLRADQIAAHAALDRAGVGERGAKLEIRIERLVDELKRKLAAAENRHGFGCECFRCKDVQFWDS